jgi:phosphoserine phosphatase RsbU/P
MNSSSKDRLSSGAVTDLGTSSASIGLSSLSDSYEGVPPLGEFQSVDEVKTLDPVLVVLPDVFERQRLTEALSSQGCRIWLATNAQTALEIAAERRPYLIVLGNDSPSDEDFHTYSALRDDPRTRDVPVILLSHSSGAGEKIRGLRTGAVDYICAPFDWAAIAAQVRNQLKLERLRRELAAVNCDLLAKQAQHQASLTAAAQIQRSLLPARSAEKFAGLSVGWKFLPLEEVGGDLLGYRWLDEDHLAAYVVDVCGHGMAAAMMTAAISTSLAPAADDRATIHSERAAFSPKQILERLDREYPLERFERPFTICYLVLNRQTGEFRCSRAGHPMPIVIRRNGQLESIEAGGTIIGLDRLLPFEEAAGKLHAGDSILLHSDGVTECTNGARSFGDQGLTEVLGQCTELEAESICEKVLNRLIDFNGGAAPRDDVTILALSYQGCHQTAGIPVSRVDDTRLISNGN